MQTRPPVQRPVIEGTEPKLSPLVLATMASQALLVALAPTIVAIGRDLRASVGAVGQARSVAAAVAIMASLAVVGRIDAVGVRRLIGTGSALAIVACAAVGLAPTFAVFLAAHLLVGLAFACLLSAGFAGVAAFSPERRQWAIGYVAGANALAWIVVNPIVGGVTEWLSWRAAQVVPAGVAVAALVTTRAVRLAPHRPAARQLTALLGERSARRWLGAEVIAYGAWTAVLTFVGAFFIERVGVPPPPRAGCSRPEPPPTSPPRLAAGSSSVSCRAGTCQRLGADHGDPALRPAHVDDLGSAGRRDLLLARLAAGVRSPASSGLGLEQLPRHPGAMMAARTAATQLGYLIGAVVGGAVISHGGYATLGIVLAIGMAGSALLVLGVDDRLEDRSPARLRGGGLPRKVFGSPRA